MIAAMTWILLALMVLPLIMMTISALKASSKLNQPWQPIFFLPHDFFISLVLMVNFWVILLILLGAQGLPAQERQVITIVLCLFAPFLGWWHKKRWERTQ